MTTTGVLHSQGRMNVIFISVGGAEEGIGLVKACNVTFSFELHGVVEFIYGSDLLLISSNNYICFFIISKFFFLFWVSGPSLSGLYIRGTQ